MQIEETQALVESIKPPSWMEIAANFPWTIQTFGTSYDLDNQGIDGVGTLTAWIEDNLGYTPAMTYGRMYFKDKDDAIMFKMRWA